MAISYQALMLDHERIEHLARLLDDDVGFLNNENSQESRHHLVELLTIINDHILVEEQVIAQIEQRHLAGRWGGRWDEVTGDVARLRAEAASMITTWSERAINNDAKGFAAAMKAFSAACRTITRREADLFYTKALDCGALSLK